MNILRRKIVLASFLIILLLTAQNVIAQGSSDKKTVQNIPSPVETEVPEFEKTQLPNIVILDGGGTITSTALGRADYPNYGKTKLEGIVEVLNRLRPEIDEVANIKIIKGAIPGSSARTTQRQLFDMTLQLDSILTNEDVDAVVVNTGTNIMEEIAYWADLTVQSEKPVVFTGSMRQSNTFSFDGEANLFNAIRVAVSNETYGFGTVVLMNDEFVAAREVTKTNAWRTDTFSGGRYGALGTVDGYNVRTVRAPARVLKSGTPEWFTPFDLSSISFDDLASAEIVYSYVEADATPITALAKEGVDGIVTAGHGAGGISTMQSEAQKTAIADGVIFAKTTRTGSGSIYDNGDPGIIGAYDLTPQKARILLQLALTFSDDEKQIREWFKTIGAPEFGEQSN